jgi:hypothetical protein
MMSTTQTSGWMFPRNTSGHHKSNVANENRIGAQTNKPQTKQETGLEILEAVAAPARPGTALDRAC